MLYLLQFLFYTTILMEVTKLSVIWFTDAMISVKESWHFLTKWTPGFKKLKQHLEAGMVARACRPSSFSDRISLCGQAGVQGRNLGSP